MSFPRYPKYKASGVEWLGDVPEGWQVRPFKYSTLVYTGNSLNETEKKLYESADPEALPYVSSKDIDLETHAVQYENGLRIPKEQCDLKVAKSGTFLLCVEGGSAGRKVALLSHDVCFVNKLCCFSSRQNNKFRFYFAQSQHFKDKFGLSLTGLIGGVSTSLLKNFQIPTPSDPEQTAIAEFLDRETGKIDGLVAEQRRLMELLKEKRQAVISHAVTKGLNPHAPMKPSGIEWLGDVPVGWEVMSLRRCKKRIQTGGTPPTADQSYYEDGTVPWFGPGSFDENLTVSEPIKWLNESAVKEGVARVFAAGATMIVTIGATLGKVSSLVEDGSCNQQITVIEFDPRRVCARFATYQIKRLEPALRAIAPSATLPILGLGEIADIDMVIPPLEDQVLIVAHLDTELAKFDTLTAEAQRAIDLLQERRTALISAAVTGQIDVRQQPRN